MSKDNEKPESQGKKLKFKRHRKAIALVVVGAAMTAAVLFGRCNCGGVAGPDGLLVKADKICTSGEQHAYIYLPDGSRVKNPYYSKEDCFKGDRIYDNGTDIRNDAGEVMDPSEIAEEYTDGTPVVIKEGPDDPDYIVQRCGKNKPLVEGLKKVSYMRQRTAEEIRDMQDNPEEKVKLGDNYTEEMVYYEETCDERLEECSPETDGKCYCSNSSACSKCGDGKIDKPQEECDPGSWRGRKPCKSDEYCAGPRSSTPCICRKKGKCGDGKVDPGEECGEPGLEDCPPGKTCKNCKCENVKCGDGKIGPGEECGEPGLKDCPPGKTCKSCKCVSELTPCPDERVNKSTLSSHRGRVTDEVMGNKGALRKSLSCPKPKEMKVRVRTKVSRRGEATVHSASAKCDAQSVGNSATILGNMQLELGDLPSMGLFEEPCFIDREVKVRK